VNIVDKRLREVKEELLEYVEGRFEGPFSVRATETYVEIVDSQDRVIASKAVN